MKILLNSKLQMSNDKGNMKFGYYEDRKLRFRKFVASQIHNFFMVWCLVFGISFI